MAAVPALPHRGSSPRHAQRPSRTEAPRRSLSVVPHHTPAGAKALRAIIGTATTLLVIVGFLGVVSLNALAAEASFEARSLTREISDLTLRHDQLVAAVAHQASPDRIRVAAVNRLGMLNPEVPGFIRVELADMPALAPKPLLVRER